MTEDTVTGAESMVEAPWYVTVMTAMREGASTDASEMDHALDEAERHFATAWGEGAGAEALRVLKGLRGLRALRAADADATPSRVLAGLRAAGWTVAVHNDYRLGGVAHTFWLLTHPDGRYLKAEGRSDAEVLEDLGRRAG